MRKYLEIKEMIMRLIRSREFSGKIPGERVLAVRFGYSYMTVRRAVCELAEEGVLLRKPRKGTFVSAGRSAHGKTGVIGLYLYEGIRNGIRNPYYSLVFENLRAELNSRGYQVRLCANGDSCEDIDCLIVSASPETENRISMISRKVPIVLIDNDIKGTSFPSVIVDNFNSTYCAIEYAINLGHRDIGYIAGLQNSPVGIKRLGGFRMAMGDYNIPVDDKYIYYGNYERESGYEGAKYFLSLNKMPTFIHCANDCMASGLISGLKERGLLIPDDVSICGFDNTDDDGDRPFLMTTMAVNVKAMARACADMALSEIKGEAQIIRKYVVPVDLLIRNSTAAPRRGE